MNAMMQTAMREMAGERLLPVLAISQVAMKGAVPPKNHDPLKLTGSKKESPMLEKAGAYAFQHKLHEGSQLQMQWLFYGHSQLPVAVQTWELPPGGFEGMHSHACPDRPLEEIYVVTEGTGQMTVENETYPVAVGDAILAKAGLRHDLQNTGEVPLKVLVIWGEPRPADYSDFGSAKKRARLARTEATPESGAAR